MQGDSIGKVEESIDLTDNSACTVSRQQEPSQKPQCQEQQTLSRQTSREPCFR